jgi:hypothetical protein
MAAHELEPADLRTVEIERFVHERRATGRVQLASIRALVRLLGYLRGLGVVPARGIAEAPTLAGTLLDRYAEYLRVQRGLALETVRCYCNTARAFLADRERIAGDLALGGAGGGRGQRVPAARVASRKRRVDEGRRHRAAVAAAVPAPGGSDRSRTRRHRPVGRAVAAGVAGQGARRRVRRAAAWQLRPLDRGRATRLRDPDVAVAAGAAHRRGRRAATRARGLARGRARCLRQGQPPGAVAAAGRRRRGNRRVAARRSAALPEPVRLYPGSGRRTRVFTPAR